MTACATDRRFAAGSPLPPSACGSQQPRRPGRGCLDFPGKQSVHGRAMDPLPSCDPLLPTLIATYLARCAVEGKSPRTIAAYRESLARFSRCLQEDGAPLDPDRLRPDHVEARDRGLGSSAAGRAQREGGRPAAHRSAPHEVAVPVATPPARLEPPAHPQRLRIRARGAGATRAADVQRGRGAAAFGGVLGLADACAG